MTLERAVPALVTSDGRCSVREGAKGPTRQGSTRARGGVARGTADPPVSSCCVQALRGLGEPPTGEEDLLYWVRWVMLVSPRNTLRLAWGDV